MTEALVETLRIRGPGATRLARIAATSLPGALDRALGTVGSGYVDALTVRLDHDLSSLDDDTIAMLWAEAIREALARALPDSPRASPADSTPRATSLPDARAGFAPAVTEESAASAARTWLAQSAPRGAAPLAIFAAAWWALPEHEALAERLAAAIGAATEAGRAGDAAAPPPAAEPPRYGDVHTAPAADPPMAWGPAATSAPGAVTGRPTPTAPGKASPRARHHGELLEVFARLAAESTQGSVGPALERAVVTSAAGLALLYPWLADFCREAMSTHAGIDEREVRVHALAALVNPDDAALLADPFVLLLAGANEPVAPTSVLRDADGIEEAAQLLLASFAALLPGFANSTAQFVRHEWIVRTGVLDADLDLVRLTAATHPLDVVLHRLPYPLGLFRLPWSAPVLMRFRP